MDKNRLDYLSITRGFGMIAVVLAHSFAPEIRGSNRAVYAIFMWICDFSMQIFMVVSGYLFQCSYSKHHKTNKTGFYIGKIKTLIVPYLSMSILSYILIGLAFFIPALAGVLYSAGYAQVGFMDAVIQIATHEGHAINHLWFLPTLFIIFIISFATDKLFLCWPGLIICAAAFLSSLYIPMPHIIYRVCALLIYFSIGRRIIFIDKFTQKNRSPYIFAIFLISSFIHRMEWFADIYVLDALFAFIVGISGALAFIALSKIISGSTTGRCIAFIGDNSMIIYLLHQPFVVSGVIGILLMYTTLPHIVICAVAVTLGLAVPLFIYKYVINKAWLLRGLFIGDFSINTTTGFR